MTNVQCGDQLDMSGLNIDDLFYRGEGNLSLVVAIDSLNKVIRMPKVNIDQNQIDLEALNSKLLNEIQFNKNVMGKLFDPWVNEYLLVKLNRQQMIEIKNKVEHLRPNYRKNKTLPSSDYFGLALDDFCGFHDERTHLNSNRTMPLKSIGPVYSIEIKPKQGFISNELIDLKICKFKLRQQEKIALSLIEHSSDYCPLDLFSGDEGRNRYALNSLLDNPQNNLRLFIDKKYIELADRSLDDELSRIPCNSMNREKVIDLLIYALNHSFGLKEKKPKHTLSQRQSQNCFYHSKIHGLDSTKQLNPNSILKSILDIQQLDRIGSTKAFELYNRLKINYKTSFDEWLHRSQYSTNLHRSNSIEMSNESSLNESDRIMQQLSDFLYSMTAKDCSIMVTFQKVEDLSLLTKNPNFESIMFSSSNDVDCSNYKSHANRLCYYRHSSDGSIYRFTIALIDLDRKQPEKVESTYKGDQKRIKDFCEFQSNLKDQKR